MATTTATGAAGTGAANTGSDTTGFDPSFTQNLNDLKSMSNLVQSEQMLMRKISMELGAEQSIAKEKPAQ